MNLRLSTVVFGLLIVTVSVCGAQALDIDSLVEKMTLEEKACMGCGACISACTYNAIEFRKTKQGKKAVVNPVLCKGDGLCNAKCPTGAIFLKHFTDDDLLSQIDEAFSEEEIMSG